MKVIFPGSFDPITIGHMDIIDRATKHFGAITVVLLNNINKKYYFDMNNRREIISEIYKDKSCVSVDVYSGMLIDYIKENNVDLIVRGIRNTLDFENEKILSSFNKKHTDVDTLLFLPNKDIEYVSSTMVKEIILCNGDVKPYVHEIVEKKIKIQEDNNGNIRID